MEKRIIKTSVANLYSKPEFTSELISQALMWEQVEVLDDYQNWLQIKQWDGYEGWMQKFYFANVSNSDMIGIFDKITISQRMSMIYSEQETDSEIIGEVAFGSVIPIINSHRTTNGHWFLIMLPEGDEGWIFQKIRRVRNIRKRIAYFAEKMLGVPYLWGGKTSLGFDCSGFVQTIFKYSNIFISRDAHLQIEQPNLETIDFSKSEPGDLVFFKENEKISHVGIALGDGAIIHCSGEVKVESLLTDGRLFNQKLANILYKTKSIRNLVKRS